MPRRLAFFPLLLIAALAAADTYVVDNTHSQIGFAVRHMGLADVQGRFNDYMALAVYEDQAPVSVTVTIKAASLDTANPERDQHLRGPDFFHTDKFPEITFTSQRVTKKGQAYQAAGKLTIRGISKPVVVPFVLAGPVDDPWGGVRLGARTELTIDRRDFGLRWGEKLPSGVAIVGNEVRLLLNVEFTKQPPAVK